MPSTINPTRDLLFGRLAPQNGLIDQGQLVAAFQAWTRDKGRPMADHLVARGDLDADDRDVVTALVARHLKKHGGDPEKSLAAINPGRSTRESLARLGDVDIEASVAHLDATSTQAGEKALGRSEPGSVERTLILRPGNWRSKKNSPTRNPMSGIIRITWLGPTATWPRVSFRWADRAMDILRRITAAGYRAPSLRTEPALDPLRARPDFRLLIMDAAFPADPFIQ